MIKINTYLSTTIWNYKLNGDNSITTSKKTLTTQKQLWLSSVTSVKSNKSKWRGFYKTTYPLHWRKINFFRLLYLQALTNNTAQQSWRGKKLGSRCNDTNSTIATVCYEQHIHCPKSGWQYVKGSSTCHSNVSRYIVDRHSSQQFYKTKQNVILQNANVPIIIQVYATPNSLGVANEDGLPLFSLLQLMICLTYTSLGNQTHWGNPVV